MKVKDIVERIKLSVITGEHKLESEIEFAFASDLMSDVLTLERTGIALITGLANNQALRTAEMSDIEVVILARKKKAGIDMIKLAEESDIILLQSNYSVFRIAGELYQAGIKPVY